MLKLKRIILLILAITSLLCVACKSTDVKPKPDKSQESSSSSGKDKSSKDKDSNENSSLDKDKNKDSSSSSGKDSKDSSSSKTGKDGTSSGSKKDNTDYNALLKKVENARQKAIDSGADDALPDVFKQAESLLEQQKKLASEGKTSAEMAEILKNLNDLYEGLSVYKEAKEKKERIDKNNYAQNLRRTYDEGSSLLDKLADLENLANQIQKNARDIVAGKKNADTAVGSDFLKKAKQADEDFVAVFKATSTNERSAALKAKKQADSVKASVSRKSEYDSGVNNFRKGDSNYVTGGVEESILNYIDSKTTFAKLYNEISKLRERAQKRLEEAKKRVEQSGNNALMADKRDPLYEKIDGIEDADAKLLEDDDFSAAENSFVELDENLSVGGQ